MARPNFGRPVILSSKGMFFGCGIKDDFTSAVVVVAVFRCGNDISADLKIFGRLRRVILQREKNRRVAYFYVTTLAMEISLIGDGDSAQRAPRR